VPASGVSIAGVRLHARAAVGTLVDVPIDLYEEFEIFELGSDPPDISMTVHAGLASEAPGPQSFDCDGSWSVHSDGLGYRLRLGLTESGEAHVEARCDADTSVVDAYVGETWARFFGDVVADWPSVVPSPLRYPLDQILIVNHLASRGGIVVHSAGLDLDGAGFVFPGVSGAGKTTLSLLLADAGWRDRLRSDDRMILRVGPDGAITAWGTPWAGDAEIARNLPLPLEALCFLKQSDEPGVISLKPAEAAARLFAVASCPWYDERLVTGVLDTVESIVTVVPSVEFRFTKDGRSVELLQSYAARLAAEHGPGG
jgi:hypothetical protein